MLCIEDFPHINECLAVPPSLEPRCVSLFVKDKFKPMFRERWEACFSDKFLLLTAKEALLTGFFGSGRPHERTDDFIGDYVAVATADIALWYRNENGGYSDFAAAHAGLRKEEMIVPLIIIEK
jgi:hypothetical protein